MFLNNQKVTEEIKSEIKFLEKSDNEKTTTQNLWDAAKAVLRGTFIAIQSYLKKQKKKKKTKNKKHNTLNRQPLHLKQLEKEEENTPKISRRKQIIKI